MQDGSNDWGDTPQELGFLTATSLTGAVVSGLVLAGWMSLASATVVTDTDVVDQGLHNLTPAECQGTLNAVLNRFRTDPRVLWLWVEQSVPTATRANTMTQDTSLSRAAPRPYAFHPGVAQLPAGLCAFERNSLHAESLGGVVGAFLEPPVEPWRVGVAP
ncbi:hypothetical protein [Azospirillum rugosum]|uniref:Uncharacterized protein n=1 Tax=Azospirillum rugosum TaxID=416170 RepID=A0ABS4SVD5_9PROT|nr:hypothetical protein [Azospirillum rugosum]MBP2296522.1 hypothetical protein [Azospirillum rugosum]MDQ0530078.1 hypothetical protein [Azospirillum rugosum]